MEAADVLIRPELRKQVAEGVSSVHRATVKDRNVPGSGKSVEEKGGFIVGLRKFRVSDNHRSEQATAYVVHQVSIVVVERPRADGVIFGIEDICPGIAGADFVASPPSGRLDAKWPRTIAVNPIVESMNVEAVGLVVRVENVDVKPFSWLRVD